MGHKVLKVSCGQGVRLGDTVWRQHCALADGKSPDTSDDGSCFFEETNGGLFVPRNLLVDVEPNVIGDNRNGDLANLFYGEFLLTGKEGAVNNFARGHYTVGNYKEIIDKVNDRMRKLVDNCHNVQGLVVNHSVGGAGSGLGALILERMVVHYRTKSKLGFEIYPSLQIFPVV